MKMLHLSAFLVLVLALIPECLAYNKTLGWQTLYKGAPIVIANGGSSGIYPDQTIPAYADAFNTSGFPLALLCDLQLTKDNQGICRTGWNLSDSTNITNVINSAPLSSHILRGEAVSGYFSVDFTLEELLVNTSAIQAVHSRSPLFDEFQNFLQTPENVSMSLSHIPPGTPLYFWLNVEYPTFYQHYPGRNSLASYLTTYLTTFEPSFLSATEVGILKLLGSTAAQSKTRLIFKVLQSNHIEESTNTTYGEILQNLTIIASFAQGILVPKDLIYGVDNVTNYLLPATNFVQAAHKANLEVFVYKFANDDYPSSFNFSFDSVREYLSYLGDSFTVDGFVTDFPTTASEAINCYPDGYQTATSRSKVAVSAGHAVMQPTVISHNGASGDFPGCSMSAYMKAIDDGADYIDCTVQMTTDGVPICREDADLLKSTNILSNQILYEDYLTTYTELQSAQGVFTFDMTWANISTLKAIMYSPWSVDWNVFRDRGNDGKERVLTLDDFLSLAKSNLGVGMYINLQNAFYLRSQHSLDLVDAVVTSLTKANLTNASDKILVASEDSSALAALQQLIPLVKLVYNVKYNAENPVSVTMPVLQEIKQYTSIVSLDRRLVDPIDQVTQFFLATKTSVVDMARSLNMTVFYNFLENEYIAYAADYRSDPILHINSLIQNFNINGFITDFPATLHAFLHKNYCYQRPGGTALNYSTVSYPIFPVSSGEITQPYGFGAESIAPSPALAVVEPSISYFVPVGSPTGGAGDRTTSSGPKAPSGISISRFASLFILFVMLEVVR